jgi:hypothetical protein
VRAEWNGAEPVATIYEICARDGTVLIDEVDRETDETAEEFCNDVEQLLAWLAGLDDEAHWITEERFDLVEGG